MYPKSPEYLQKKSHPEEEQLEKVKYIYICHFSMSSLWTTTCLSSPHLLPPYVKSIM